MQTTMQTTFSAFRITGSGFQIGWEHRYRPEFPVFVQLTKGGLSLYLSQHKGDCRVGGLAYFYVSDVDVWYNECRRLGIVPSIMPKNQPWGNREMRLTDPDGNQLCICQRLNVQVCLIKSAEVLWSNLKLGCLLKRTS